MFDSASIPLVGAAGFLIGRDSWSTCWGRKSPWAVAFLGIFFIALVPVLVALQKLSLAPQSQSPASAFMQ